MERKVLVFKNYFWDFYNEQPLSVQEKIDYVIKLVKTIHRVPEKFLKHIEGTDSLYEMRIEVGSNTYRVFCFFDAGNLIILATAFKRNRKRRQKMKLNVH